MRSGKNKCERAVTDLGNYQPLKEGDKATVTRQLGRQPRNLVGVAARCPAGAPRVIVTHPVIYHDGVFPEVFPTLYWLSCPRLVKEISRMEGAGAIEEIQELILDDPEPKKALEDEHEMYAKQRMALVKDVTLHSLEDDYPTQYEVLVHSGVGGIMDQGIKCLHTHFADYLVNGTNPVGKIVAGRLGEKIEELCKECVEEE